MQATQCWFIGECMIELRRAGKDRFMQSFSGDVYNTAVYFRRSSTFTSTLISAVGIDSMSAALRLHAYEQGLDTSRILSLPNYAPGLYMIETTPDGERSFLYWRENSAARQMLTHEHADALESDAAHCRLLYFSGITLAILDERRRERLLALAASIRKSGGWIGFDSNYRPKLWRDKSSAVRWTDAALATASHALVTYDDEQDLHGDTAPSATLARILKAGAAEAVVKLGSDGCLAQSSSMPDAIAVPAEKVIPVDTTAAGDSFNAAYLAARLGEESLEDAARAGVHLAARVIRFPGAIIDAHDGVSQSGG
ncbi:sugar kinase [Noviherbaspirillum sp.]|uniref:sugar kinase n=1 Tax=Noviherbaspirillum sp. TaxID=1926288 RepID=UPI002FE36D98